MFREHVMKKLLTILFYIFALTLTLLQIDAQQQKPKTKVETDYDSKKDETTARIGPFPLYEPEQNSDSGELDFNRVDLRVSFAYRGKKVTKPKVVTLMVFSSNEGGDQFDKKRDLSVITNSGKYDLGDMEIIWRGEGRVAKKIMGPANLLLVREVLVKSIPFDDFVSISKAEKVKMKVGNRGFKIEKKFLEAFRNFILLMEQEGLEF